MMAMASTLKLQTHITKMSIIKVTTIKDTSINMAVRPKNMDIRNMAMVAIMMNPGTTTPTQVIPTIKMVATTKVNNTGIRMSTTTISIMIRGPQLLVSNPNMDRVAMGLWFLSYE